MRILPRFQVTRGNEAKCHTAHQGHLPRERAARKSNL